MSIEQKIEENTAAIKALTTAIERLYFNHSMTEVEVEQQTCESSVKKPKPKTKVKPKEEEPKEETPSFDSTVTAELNKETQATGTAATAATASLSLVKQTMESLRNNEASLDVIEVPKEAKSPEDLRRELVSLATKLILADRSKMITILSAVGAANVSAIKDDKLVESIDLIQEALK